jgi:hypothetical protein
VSCDCYTCFLLNPFFFVHAFISQQTHQRQSFKQSPKASCHGEHYRPRPPHDTYQNVTTKDMKHGKQMCHAQVSVSSTGRLLGLFGFYSLHWLQQSSWDQNHSPTFTIIVSLVVDIVLPTLLCVWASTPDISHSLSFRHEDKSSQGPVSLVNSGCWETRRALQRQVEPRGSREHAGDESTSQSVFRRALDRDSSRSLSSVGRRGHRKQRRTGAEPSV